MGVKVSVIVPVYNSGEFLENTIKKIRNQTLKDIEIILVDDGSTDRSPEICDSLAEEDARIKCIHIKNSGVCVARNRGMSAACGKYIGFSDADDIPDENLYETLYSLAEENNCQVSMVKYATVFEDGKVINSDGTDKITVYHSKSEVLADFLSDKLLSGVYTKLFRRDLCSEISFEEGRKINEDKMFIFDALRKAESGCYRDISLYTYIRRKGSSSNSVFSEKHFDCIYFADKIQSIVEKDFTEIVDYAKCNSVCTYMKVLKLMCLTGKSEKYSNEFDEYTKYLRSYKTSFCKKHLRKNDFIKWFGLKINKNVFKILVKKFSRT